MPATHPSDDGPVLDAHVRCVRCRYDLAGMHAFGRCPECGSPVIASLAEHADAEIADLALPDDGKAAAAAVVAVTVAPLACALLQGSGPAMRQVDALAGRGSSFPSQVERPAWLVCAVAIGVATAIAARGLTRARNPALHASLGHGRLVRLQLAGWSWCAVLAGAFVFSLMPAGNFASMPIAALAAQLLPAVMWLMCAAPVLARLGALSRTYREARHGQQSAELVSLTLAVGITLAVAMPAVRAALGEDWGMVGSVLALFLVLLTVLGMAYMAANGWVIAQALRRPRIDPRRLR
jgi:hypothetical protein